MEDYRLASDTRVSVRERVALHETVMDRGVLRILLPLFREGDSNAASESLRAAGLGNEDDREFLILSPQIQQRAESLPSREWVPEET
jgi:hypothetical protein